MRTTLILTACGLFLAACSTTPPVPKEGAPTLFEGALLISGEPGVVIENSAFLVADGKFTKVGKKAEIELPAGGARVDLTGKTVMPAIIDDHAHLGWQIVKTGTIGVDTYTRANLEDHLRRVAYYGVALTQNLGIDPGETPYEVRAAAANGMALFRTAGRGMALPNMGPGQAYWRPVAYGVATEAEARKAVQELAAKKADIIKMWVDDRNGTVKKLPSNIRRAIIDEAHKNGLRAIAHIFYLADAKELLREGIDAFAHGVRDKDIDDEFMKLMKQHPNVFMIPNLPDNPDNKPDAAWLKETIPGPIVDKMMEAFAKRTEKEEKTAHDFFGIQSRNLAKLNAAGVTIAFGTDSGVSLGWTAHAELSDMALSGMTAAQVITAATKTAAEIVKMDDLGTIAPAKTASFIVLDANPLDDMKNSRRISQVYLKGSALDRAKMSASFTAP